MTAFHLFIFGLWCITGALGGAIHLAYFYRQFPSMRIPYRELRNSEFWSLFGPLCLIVAIIVLQSKHGLMFRLPPCHKPTTRSTLPVS